MVHSHKKIDRWVRMVLVIGMALSISVMVIGLVMFALSPNHPEADLPLSQIPSQIRAGNPVAVIDLGIILLIATPLTRVITALLVFTVDRELRFVLASLLVLVFITLAILIG